MWEFVCVCECVCLCAGVCVCECACECVCLCAEVRVWVCACECVCLCAEVCVCACECVFVCVCVSECVCVWVCVSECVCVWVCVSECVCEWYKRLAFSFCALCWIFYNCVCLHAAYSYQASFLTGKASKETLWISRSTFESNLLSEFTAFFQIYCQIQTVLYEIWSSLYRKFHESPLGVGRGEWVWGKALCSLLGVYPLCRETSCFSRQVCAGVPYDGCIR